MAALCRFFIDRPIFASVLSIVIVIAGAVAVPGLPVAQYPEIAPPVISVACVYPGASAAVLADTVAAPIEQQVTGVENVLYMSSQCTNDGQYLLTVTFDLGVDLDMAQVLVQNRVNLALPGLPEVVRQTGVSVRKKSPSILLVINLFSPDGTWDQLGLSNYATINLRDELVQIGGVGDLQMFGQQDYSMRVWLDPDKVAAQGSEYFGGGSGAAGAERAGRGGVTGATTGACRSGVPVFAEYSGASAGGRPVFPDHHSHREDG